MTMWKKTISLLIAIILVLAGSAGITYAASDNQHSPNSATIEISGENRYKAVRLTPEIYSASNSDLSDILIKDGNGENVPYFINSGFENTYASRETYSLYLIDSYIKDDDFYFDYALAAAQSGDVIATSIEFSTTNTAFMKVVDVYGSYDNMNWNLIQNDKLYVVDDKSKLAIEFAKPQKYTHYRLKLANNLEQISFETAELVYSIETNEETYFTENLKPEFKIESVNKKTNIIISGLKHLRLCGVTIETDSMFKRIARAPGGAEKEIYNLSFDGVSYADTTIPLGWYISPDDTFVITITDADDKPISISGVSVRYFADEIVFEGTAGEVYILEFGNDSIKTAPVYDIERYKDEILNGKIDKVTIGKISYGATKEVSPEKDYKMVFNIVIIAVAILLGTVIIFKLRR